MTEFETGIIDALTDIGSAIEHLADAVESSFTGGEIESPQDFNVVHALMKLASATGNLEYLSGIHECLKNLHVMSDVGGGLNIEVDGGLIVNSDDE